ncbi:MAG: hypothetical protein V4550_15430 [Gemmatimonadota bacterium]
MAERNHEIIERKLVARRRRGRLVEPPRAAEDLWCDGQGVDDLDGIRGDHATIRPAQLQG